MRESWREIISAGRSSDVLGAVAMETRSRGGFALVVVLVEVAEVLGQCLWSVKVCHLDDAVLARNVPENDRTYKKYSRDQRFKTKNEV